MTSALVKSRGCRKLTHCSLTPRDYVEKIVMSKAMTQSTDYMDVRNQAARALHKKGKHVPSQIDRTIRSTKVRA